MRSRKLSPAGKIIGGVTLLYIMIAIFFGATTGIGLFTFGYAEGGSYLTDRSEACANCHVMQKHLDAWVKSSHGKFASCNDCHAPDDFFGKYYCKTRNGFFHSLAFTTGNFPDRFQMNEFNHNVVEQNCRRCHADVTHQMDTFRVGSGKMETTSCLHCHATVGHDT